MTGVDLLAKFNDLKIEGLQPKLEKIFDESIEKQQIFILGNQNKSWSVETLTFHRLQKNAQILLPRAARESVVSAYHDFGPNVFQTLASHERNTRSITRDCRLHKFQIENPAWMQEYNQWMLCDAPNQAFGSNFEIFNEGNIFKNNLERLMVDEKTPSYFKLLALTGYMMANIQPQVELTRNGDALLSIDERTKMKQKSNYCQVFVLSYLLKLFYSDH